MLREAGFGVVEASDGRTALEIAQREVPDLVLLDVNLPDMHGFEISEKLKSLQATKHIPIVHISATSRGDRLQREAIAAGAAAFIQEPLPPKELLRMIGEILANAGSSTEPPVEARSKPSRNSP
jgi:two-component system cell cycle response regulator DivK